MNGCTRPATWYAAAPDGALEYLDRSDHQLKLRGFRIELGEIEAALRGAPGVREAVVVLRDEAAGERRLVAYVVGANGQRPDARELRGYLKAHLPEYMVPAAFVTLDALPQTPNGKVDRKALPAPTMESQEEAPVALPRTELERMIADVWRRVLRVERVGVHDNFFDLGGHSLLLIQVHQQLRAAVRDDLSVVDLFANPTIASLAAFLSGETVVEPQAQAQAVRRGNERAATDRSRDVAIVGMGIRFPGARDVAEFWRNIAEGRESVAVFSDAELLAAGEDPALLADPRYVRREATLEGIDQFDADFFGFTPREAEILDPQQRLFLECAWEALEAAGHDPARYAGRIGVYAGAGMSRYLLDNLLPHRDIVAAMGDFQLMLSNDKDFLPTRVSYKLNLNGPSVSVNTACSTSLVAVHMARQSLLNGECDMALAGGVTIAATQPRGYLYEQGGILSADGHCRAFDADASGTVGGSGAGIVVLKRLVDALADGDTIHAVIKGSAINNDGAQKVGFTAPSVEGQAAVIAQAQADAGIAP
ncbi:MAG: beta-ketoacyl synthase N-terminal-like domain-containing protein, partial [Chloroflexia bacterium]